MFFQFILCAVSSSYEMSRGKIFILDYSLAPGVLYIKVWEGGCPMYLQIEK